MEKELPINLNTGITDECWTFYRLAVVLSDKRYLPWYIEKFNNYFINERFNLLFETGDSIGGNLCYYDEIIEFKKIKQTSDIVSSIIDEINNGAYILCYYDRFYSKGSPEYEKKHSAHDMLIYGYNTDLKLLNFIDININGILWGKHTISFTEFTCAYDGVLKIISEEPEKWTWLYYFYLPASALYLNKNFYRKPRLEVFYNQIEKCLKGGEILSLERMGEQITYKRFGVSVYKSYYEDLYNVIYKKKDFLIFEGNTKILFSMRSLIESKYALILKLNYLNENGLLLVPSSIIKNVERLCGVIECAYQLMIKNSYNLDVNILKRAKNKFIEAEKIDIDVLTEIRNVLYEHIKAGIIRC